MRLVAALVGAGLFPGAAPATLPSPEFSAAVSPTRWVDVRHTWRRGCPVSPLDLRVIRLSYWGYDGRVHLGRLVVHRRVTGDLVAVFRRLYEGRFPIRRMIPVSRYGGSDDASMAADNTSAFNCRFVSGSRRWSMHAYGLAIDVNPVENPYVSGSRVRPPAGRRYVDRSRRRPGMAFAGGILVDAFASVGWRWGGNWAGTPDYQHFSTTGR